MCKIQELMREVPFESVVNQLNDPNRRGFTLKVDDCPPFFFRTSTRSKYRVVEKIIIAVNDTKNCDKDRMIPHREMRKILSNCGIDECFVDQLREEFPNVVFIAKNPQFETYRP